MRKFMLFVGVAAILASCGQSNGGATANQAAAAPPKKKPPHCFFKDADMKEWAASRDKDGNIVVKGRAYRSDPRYKALLNPAIVTGTSAQIAPTIALNDTGYGAPDNWWDVKATIPNSAAIETVNVT